MQLRRAATFPACKLNSRLRKTDIFSCCIRSQLRITDTFTLPRRQQLWSSGREVGKPLDHHSGLINHTQLPLKMMAEHLESATDPDRAFQYSPLQTPATQIRLFRIRPSDDPDRTLRCAMTKHELPPPPGILYNAVSYMWQPEHPYQDIRINGRNHRIGFNLCRFLLRLRARGGTGLLWADALCIDQQNIEERNAQVAVMSNFYQRAHEVLCWVGGEDYDSRMLLRKISTRKAMHRRTWVVDDSLALWKALRSFAEREYWNRVWIIPEVLSKSQARVIVHCGRESITLERLHSVCDLALDALGIRKSFSEPSSHDPLPLPAGWTFEDAAKLARSIKDSNMLQLSHKCGHTSLWDLLERHGTSGCLDPRDKVYALLSVAENAVWLECPLRPDYEKDIQILITDVLVFCNRERLECLQQLVGWILPGHEVPSSCLDSGVDRTVATEYQASRRLVRCLLPRMLSTMMP